MKPTIMDELLMTDSYQGSLDRALERDANKDGESYRGLMKAARETDTDGTGEEEAAKLYQGMVMKDASDVRFFVDLLQGRKRPDMKTPQIGETVKDFLSAKDFPFIFSPAIEIVMKQYIMPQILVSNEIFQTIPFTGMRDQINFRTIGPIDIEEVGSGEAYPEVGGSIVDKAFRTAMDIRKYGVKLGIEQELWDSDHWGILGLLFSQIADGFILHRETKAMQLLNKMGVTIFNNKTPSAGIMKRVTEGRDIAGNLNGTLTLNDLMEVYTYGNTRGFNYNTLLMHPFAWQMFATNPELREVVIQGSTVQSALSSPRRTGSQSPGFESPGGEMWGYKLSGLGGQNPTQPIYSPNNALDPFLGKLGISPAAETLTPWGATYNIPPGGFWPGGLRVIVTPYIPWAQDATSKKYITNLYFVDPQRTGIILQGEGPTTDEWEDTEREIRYIKFKTRFGMAAVYQGRGVGVVRNLVIDRSYVFDNVNQVTLAPVTAASTIPSVSFP